MKGIDRTFYAEVNERKRIARSANKRGGKSKKCTLPYETMGRKERKEYMQAGEVTTFKVKPMKLSEFNKVEGDKKIILLKWYGERYGWNAAGIASALDCSYETGRSLLDKYMLKDMFAKKMKESTLEEKKAFIENRKEIEYLIYGEKQAKNDTSTDGEQTTPAEPENAPTVEKTAISPIPWFVMALEGQKIGATLRYQLEGIAHTLDLGEKYNISLTISLATE